jgi:hypothetical protein
MPEPAPPLASEHNAASTVTDKNTVGFHYRACAAERCHRYNVFIPLLRPSVPLALTALLLLATACERERIVDPGPDLTPPLPPTGLLVESSRDGFIFISWNINREHDLAGYNVYRSEQADSADFRSIATTTDFFYVDLQRSYDTLYWYRVTAFDLNGNESPPSPQVSARSPNRFPPDSPAGFNLNGLNDGERRMFRLSWSDIDEADLRGFHIYRSASPLTTADSALRIAETEMTFYDDTTVNTSGQKMYYGVTAVDRGGLESDLSPVASDIISPRPQLLLPTENAGVGAFPMFSWLPVTGSVSYRISFSDAPSAGERWTATVSHDMRDTMTLRYTGPALPLGTTLYWRVSTITAANGRVNGISESRRMIVRY